MSEHGDNEVRTSLGAYVLGQLDPGATAHVEEHLRRCPACRAEVDGLRPVASALGELRRDGSGEPGALPPSELGARITGSIGAARRDLDRTARRRPYVLGVLAGAAVAASLVAGLVVLTDDDPAPRATIPIEAVPVEVEQPGVTADAGVVPHTWGVEVKLSATGFVRGETYRVAVVRQDGGRSPAGEFLGTGSKPMVCNLNSSVLRPSAEGFEVRDRQGDVVVVSHFR